MASVTLLPCITKIRDCYVVGRFAEFGLTVEPTDTVVMSDRPLILDCVAQYTDDTGTHAASVQWLKNLQPIVLSPPNKYGLLLVFCLDGSDSFCPMLDPRTIRIWSIHSEARNRET